MLYELIQFAFCKLHICNHTCKLTCKYLILDYATIEANATLNINYVTSPIMSDDPAALITMYVSINIRNINVKKRNYAATQYCVK